MSVIVSQGGEFFITCPLRQLAVILEQNDGKLSKRARNKEFAALTDDEVRDVEGIYADAQGD